MYVAWLLPHIPNRSTPNWSTRVFLIDAAGVIVNYVTVITHFHHHIDYVKQQIIAYARSTERPLASLLSTTLSPNAIAPFLPMLPRSHSSASTLLTLLVRLILFLLIPPAQSIPLHRHHIAFPETHLPFFSPCSFHSHLFHNNATISLPSSSPPHLQNPPLQQWLKLPHHWSHNIHQVPCSLPTISPLLSPSPWELSSGTHRIPSLVTPTTPPIPSTNKTNFN